jgi:hypothetical protein
MEKGRAQRVHDKRLVEAAMAAAAAGEWSSISGIAISAFGASV